MLHQEIEDKIYQYIVDYEKIHDTCPTMHEIFDAGLGAKSWLTLSQYINDLIGDAKLIRANNKSRVLIPGKTIATVGDETYRMRYKKEYVVLDVLFSAEGVLTPLSFTLPDGHVHKVESVIDTKPKPNFKPGFYVYRYQVRVAGMEKYLFMEMPIESEKFIMRWFMETPIVEYLIK